MSSTQLPPDTDGVKTGSAGDGLDPLSLASTIGTWLAALIAIIALLGVVAPYLALKASMSDKTRAMNAVQDIPQKYVTRGVRLYEGLRVFRKIRVPNLAPSHTTNGDDTDPLIPSAAAVGVWTLRATENFHLWNSGWAKMAELIESYSVVDPTTKLDIGLGIPSNGTLEIVNNRTALVVHKHWIMLLGLLGRYGKRPDRGILQSRGLLRSFPGERAGFGLAENDAPRQMFADESSSSSSSGLSSSSEDDGLIHPVDDSVGTTHYTFTNSTLTQRRGGEDRLPNLRVNRQPWGGIVIRQEEKPMTGITGTMENIGRNRGSWNYLSSIVFFPHTARSIFPAADSGKAEASPLSFLYWLAHGFIPYTTGGKATGCTTVFCLESPTDGLGHRYRTKLRDREQVMNFFHLEESALLDIPLSVRNSMQCLGMPGVSVRYFAPAERSMDPSEIESYKDRILAADCVHARKRRRVAMFESDSDEEEVNYYDKHQPISIFADDEWVLIPTSRNTPWHFYKRQDIEVILESLFCLDWDPWGYLIWRKSTHFWRRLLRVSTAILRLKKTPMTEDLIRNLTGSLPDGPVPQWRVGESFHAQKTANFVQFENFLFRSFGEERAPSEKSGIITEIKPLCIPIATLFIIDRSFQDTVQNLMRVAAVERYGTKILGGATFRSTVDEAILISLGILDEHKPAPKPGPRTRGGKRKGRIPPFIKARMRLAHQSTGRLNARGSRRRETGDDSTGNTNGDTKLEVEEQDEMGQLKEREQAKPDSGEEQPNKPLQDSDLVDLLGSFSYDHATHILTWRFTSGILAAEKSWKLNYTKSPQSPTPAPPPVSSTAESEVSLNTTDVITVGLWAAVRATLWLSSQDSKPLLEFVSDLDHHVYVLG